MRISDWSSDVCSSDLVRYSRDPGASEEVRDTSRAEFHFRIAEVATMLLLPLLAVSLGVPPKRSTSALGVFLGIVMIVSYHKEIGRASCRERMCQYGWRSVVAVYLKNTQKTNTTR